METVQIQFETLTERRTIPGVWPGRTVEYNHMTPILVVWFGGEGIARRLNPEVRDGDKFGTGASGPGRG